MFYWMSTNMLDISALAGLQSHFRCNCGVWLPESSERVNALIFVGRQDVSDSFTVLRQLALFTCIHCLLFPSKTTKCRIKNDDNGCPAEHNSYSEIQGSYQVKVSTETYKNNSKPLPTYSLLPQLVNKALNTRSYTAFLCTLMLRSAIYKERRMQR